MKKIYFPLIALAAGFVNAVLAVGVHPLFFALLPILAFMFGYYSSWRWGLLCSFLLFMSYTFGITLFFWGLGSPNLLYPIPYISAFFNGGFIIVLVGTLAPLVRRSVKRPVSIITLIILASITGLSAYAALPHYGYYYQVTLESSENLNNLELFPPAGAISGKPYDQLYLHPYETSHLFMAPDDFTQEIVDTQYGPMLKLAIPSLKPDSGPQPIYRANLVFWQKSTPAQLLQLMPKLDVVTLNQVTSQRSIGPLKSFESLTAERFDVPVKITADKQAQIKLQLWNRTDRSQAVDFTLSKTYPHTERTSYDLQTGDQWVLIPVESSVVTEISGLSD